MSSVVTVNTYTHSVTYVADNIFKSLKDIVVLCGLDVGNLIGSRESIVLAMRTWLESRHLEVVVLEVFSARTDALVTRWDIEVAYGWSGDGSFWTDTDQLKYAIRKAGVDPAAAKYRVIFQNRPGRPDVPGWGPCEYRSVEGLVRQGLGATVAHSGLTGSTTYYRRGA